MSDASGKFRATRTGSTITLSCWNGASWVALKSGGYSTADVQVRIATFVPGDFAAPSTGHEAQFDNLVITSGGDTVPVANPAVMILCAAMMVRIGAMAVVRTRGSMT
jgi:hypothetical protein